MGKSMRKVAQEAAKERLEKDVTLINAALDEGFTTAEEISKSTDLKVWHIYNIFQKDRDLYNRYVIRRKALANQAADNLAAIVADRDHPQNAAISKFIVTKYKSDFDSILESQDTQEISVEVPSGKESERPVKVIFSKK